MDAGVGAVTVCVPFGELGAPSCPSGLSAREEEAKRDGQIEGLDFKLSLED